MKTTTKILSFISLGILVLSMFAVALAFLLGQPLSELLYGREVTPTVPWSDAISLALQFAAAIVVCIFAGQQKIGIWPEIVVVACRAVSGTLIFLITRLESNLMIPLLARSLSADQLGDFLPQDPVVPRFGAVQRH